MTSSVARNPVARAAAPPSGAGPRRLPLLDQYLREQQTLTAVERFAQRHHEAKGRTYSDLLPSGRPQGGQQYAFRVDLDACTSCKACVTACHNLNGLDPAETWRTVGLLHGGTSAAPVKLSVTTACHHCLDPACMNGCPVNAYEKDPVTGIVKHLDDQCIGCQYCTFTCPYEVPQYSPERGIVRKCDMCSDRLAEGEAPACVQACPNEAIAITIVDRRQALEDAQGDAFVPGAPSPGITVPTTVYTTERALPRNLLPANFYTVKPSHAHKPLVAMLVLTQLSVGAFCVDAIARRFVEPATLGALGAVHALVAVVAGLAALGASVFHLGRPLYAFRALLGLRTSWMSREILAFGLFAPLAMLYAAAAWWQAPLARLALGVDVTPAVDALRAVVATTGLVGVTCSVLIYHVTRRAYWGAPATGFKFLMTTAVLGLSTTLLTFTAGAVALHDARTSGALVPLMRTLSTTLAAFSLVKLAGEAIFLRHRYDKRQTEEKRAALLLLGDLRSHTLARFLLLAVGGVLLPAIEACGNVPLGVVAASFVLLLAGEIVERTLFFAAASPSGMPGGLR